MISILVPSRGRPEALRQMWQTARERSNRGEAELVCRLDEDDPELEHYLQWTAGAPDVTTEVGPRLLLSECWNVCYEKASGDVLMHCGDDIRFRTQRWPELVEVGFGRWPDRLCLVYGRDGIQDQGLATHGFYSRAWVDVLGYFVPPLYSSDYNDLHLFELAQALDRLVYIPGLYTEHLHPLIGKGEWDVTHQERLARHERDRPDLLYAAQASARAADVEKLRRAIGEFGA